MGKNVWRKTLSEELEPLKIFIGWDSREDIAYQVCKQSILDTATVPVEIIPLKLDELQKQNLYTREQDVLGSTEFTFSRFMIPYLTDYKGWALFIDCDFIFKKDVAHLFELKDDKYAVMCAHHDYTPKEGSKMDGQAQLPYPRKNWSSMVLWNCEHPSNKKVDLRLINDKKTSGAFLHRFSWLADKEVGEITHQWNWLVGWYKEPQDGTPWALHYTEGGPWFEGFEDCEYALDWVRSKSNYYQSQLGKFYARDNRAALRKIDVNELTVSEHAKQLLNLTLQELVDPNELVYKETKSKIQQIKEDAMGKKVAAINMPDFNKLGVKAKGLAYDPFCEDFILGSGGTLSDFDRQVGTDNALVIRGLGGGGQKAIKYCKENNRDFYAIDTGYMQPGSRKDYHRITKNNLQNLGPIIERPDDRLSTLGWRGKKMRKGSYILICPPSPKVMKFYGQDVDEWMEHVLSELPKYTDRELNVRLKPSRRERVSNMSIYDALEEAHCLVTFNSIAATEALFFGKPAIALAPNAAQALCNNKLSEVEDLNYPSLDEVHAFAAHLSYCQFTPNELRTGYAWSIVNEGS